MINKYNFVYTLFTNMAAVHNNAESTAREKEKYSSKVNSHCDCSKLAKID